MSEKFDILKMFSSPFTLLYWVKSLMIGLGICMIAFTGFGLYKAFIKKPLASTDQKADKIYNYYHQPRVTFGCAHWQGIPITNEVK